MSEVVLDASALLALLNAEPGADTVTEALPGAAISAVNLSETVSRLCAAGMSKNAIRQALEHLGLEVINFDEDQAYESGMLRAHTIDAGLSLGDRACLVLGKVLGRTVLTADKSWLALNIGVKVQAIR